MSPAGRRRQVVRGLIGLLVGFGGAAGTLAAIEQFGGGASGEPMQLGPLDFDGYCARDPGMTALLTTSDPYGWQCVGYRADVWGQYPIDPTHVCRWQHGDDAYAVLVEPTDTVGWACFSDG